MLIIRGQGTLPGSPPWSLPWILRGRYRAHSIMVILLVGRLRSKGEVIQGLTGFSGTHRTNRSRYKATKPKNGSQIPCSMGPTPTYPTSITLYTEALSFQKHFHACPPLHLVPIEEGVGPGNEAHQIRSQADWGWRAILPLASCETSTSDHCRNHCFLMCKKGVYLKPFQGLLGGFDVNLCKRVGTEPGPCQAVCVC